MAAPGGHNEMDGRGLARFVRDQLRLGTWSFSLTGAVLFGSYARGTAEKDSDVDLLVVARNLPPRRHRRKEEILQIKTVMPGLPLDVLLLTPEECEANFRGHNPLFLDIAEHGVLLFDADGSLKALMAETRRYVQEHGVRRSGDGWLFPVRKRVPTPLSPVSNKDFAQAMLADGSRDNEIGDRLLADGYYDKAVYHFQQAAEKGVKAILICFGSVHKTHFVGSILDAFVEREDLPNKTRQALKEAARLSSKLEPEGTLSRYPGMSENSLWIPCEQYTSEDAQSSKQDAGRVIDIAREFLKEWFGGREGN